jgi:hypothetical protein
MQTAQMESFMLYRPTVLISTKISEHEVIGYMGGWKEDVLPAFFRPMILTTRHVVFFL